jgi:dGTPase
MIVNIIENSDDGNGIRMSGEFQEATNRLRFFMFENVYVGSIAKKEESKAERMIRELYLYLIQKTELLPKDFQMEIAGDGVERVVLDYVAGMTDRYAVKKFQEIYVPVSWLN